MFDRFLPWVAAFVTRRPGLVLATVAVVTVGLGAQVRLLEADPSPTALLASANPDQAAFAHAFRGIFGSTDNVVLVVVEADDVIAAAPLEYLYTAGEQFSQLPGAERVDSVARTPFPRPAHSPTNPTDDDGGELTLDDLDDATQDNPVLNDPDVLGALSDVVASAPDLFPLGLASLAERTSSRGTNIRPLIDNGNVTADDVKRVHETLASVPLLEGRLISRDRKAAIVAVTFRDDQTTQAAVTAAVDSVESWVKSHPAPAGVRVHLGGLPVLRTAIVRNMRSDQLVLVPGTLLVSLLALIVSFRWLPGIVLPIVAVGVTIACVLGGMGLAHEPLNVINNVMAPLLIILGLENSVHFISRYREEFARMRDRRAALVETVQHMGGACWAAAATTTAGLFALVTSQTHMLRAFGVVSGLGVLLVYLVTVFLLPAALIRLAPPHPEDQTKAARSPLVKAIGVLTTMVLARPWVVLVATVIVTAAATFVALDVRVDSALLDQFRKDDPAYATTKLLEQKLDGVRPLELSLESDQLDRFYDPELLKAVDRVATWVSRQDGVLSTMDATDHLTEAWSQLAGERVATAAALRSKEQLKGLAKLFEKRPKNPLRDYLTADGRHARLRIKLADNGSRATLRLVAELDQKLNAELGGFKDVRYGYTGDAYMSSIGLQAVVADLWGSLGSATVVILILVVLLFRSVRLGILCVAPQLVPLVLAMAWMVLRDIPLNAATAIIFSISIGLTVDGSIYVVARFREETKRGLLLTTALVRAARGTGVANIVSYGVLMCGFAVLLLSNFVPVQRFSELIAVSIAGCFVTTLIVQPALLRVAAASGRKT